MKIICELVSRETNFHITSVELPMPMTGFGANIDNPFPASDLAAVVIFEDRADVTYRVAQAHGDLGTWEAA